MTLKILHGALLVGLVLWGLSACTHFPNEKIENESGIAAPAGALAPTVVPVSPPSPKFLHPCAYIRATYAADFLFDSGSSAPQKADIDRLRKLLERAAVNPRFKGWHIVVVVGHADASGTKLGNLRLSIARAKAIRQLLMQLGVNESALEVEGKGSTQPVSPNDTSEGRAKNRRVEVEFIFTCG